VAVALTGAICGAFGEPAAHADDAQTRVVVEATDPARVCPPLTRLEESAKGAVARTRPGEAPKEIRATVRVDGATTFGRVVVVLADERVAEREIQGPNCASVIEALAIVLAQTIDVGGDGEAPTPQEPTEPKPASPPPPANASPPRRSSQPPTRSGPARVLSFSSRAGATAIGGVMPGLGIRPAFGLSMSTAANGWSEVVLDGAPFFMRRLSSIRFLGFETELRICPAVLAYVGKRAGVGACALGTAAWLDGATFGLARNGRGGALVPTAGAAAAFHAPLTATVGVYAEAGGSLRLTPVDFHAERVGVLYEVPIFGARVGAGLTFLLTRK
jgi:hypothetical protein